MKVQSNSGNKLQGKIKSVECINFVAFSHMIYQPNPYLNILIGPNGTGKSSIVSAIVLGLGGEPKLLNRSYLITDYIRGTADKAIIKIVLYKDDENEITFCREFNDEGVSKFSVDGRILPKKQFLSIVISLKIQVGNLCQFLPQDRVQDFLKMDCHELLINTITSVSDQQLIDDFTKLKEMQKTYIESGYTQKRDSERLQQLCARMEQLQISVNELNERNQYQKDIYALKAKKLWLEIEELNGNEFKLNTDMSLANSQLQQRTEAYNQLLKGSQHIQETCALLKKDYLAKEFLISNTLDSKNQVDDEIERLRSEISEKNSILKVNKKNRDQQKEKVLEENQVMAALEKDLNNMNDLIEKKIEEKELLEKHMQHLQNSIRLHKATRLNKVNVLEYEYVPERRMLEQRLSRLENVTERKISMLNTQNPNLSKAISWCNENRALFQANVYNPMILELNVPDEQNAKYLENVISIRDFLAFCCESREDLSLLVSELCMKRNYGINILHTPTAKHCTYKSRIPISRLTEFGFTSFLVDLVQGPAPIINKLCSAYHIHMIPVGNESVSDYTEKIPPEIRMFFGGSNKYKISGSKYCDDRILTENHIKGKHLLSTVNSYEIQELKRRLLELIKKTDICKNEISNIESIIADVEQKYKTTLEAKKVIDAHCQHRRNLIKDIERQKGKIKRLEFEIDSVETREQEFQIFSKELVNKILKLEMSKLDMQRKLQTIMNEKFYAQTKECIHKSQYMTQTCNLAEAKEKMTDATNIVENIKKLVENTQRKIEEKMSEAKRFCNNCSPADCNFPFKEEFEQYAEWDLEKIKDTLAEYEARLECIGNSNQQAINEYNKVCQEITDLENKIHRTEALNKDCEENIRAKYQSWIPNLDKLINTIKTQFCHFMSSINCVGDVVLYKTDELSFDSYGIQIMVQFRRNQELQPLNRYLQSGGERAVAIALYTLSLQHITQVPFRCVDEINQGMDVINERNVFEMLIQEVTKSDSSQYIFVTPKLLHNIQYNDKVCISIVNNSANMIAKGFPAR